MKHRVIAISREFGSGGRTIGKKTAERLGIPCYDTQLLQKVAEESGLLVAAETLEGENLLSSMSSYAVERPVPPDTSYELPDVTVLHTAGVS